mmetsp:Transcript_15753/g.50787  ORF Transcript_15753/g.50787 Transcript_15753/m.50787 type:complete len:292 (+) Transcript_15753:1056-1931(+)
MVPSGRPAPPYRLETSLERMAPTARFRLLSGRSMLTGVADSSAGAAASTRSRSRMESRPVASREKWSCPIVLICGSPGASEAAGVRMGPKSSSRVFSLRCASSTRSMSARPTISSIERKPMLAMWPRTSSARWKKKLTTCSGLPANFARSSGSCVAMPTGQVLRWHLRIMMQPSAISGVVAKPNSSAPSSAAIVTSRPVLSWPSDCSTIRERSRLSTSVWWASASPSSQGRPACLMPVHAAAPVPPSPPEMTMWSALALATPAATTPTPTSETSFTETRAARLALLRSWMS